MTKNINCDYEIEIEFAASTVYAAVTVTGRFANATWDDPAETPDAEIIRVFRAVTDDETGEVIETEITVASLTHNEYSSILDRAITIAEEQSWDPREYNSEEAYD